MSVIEEADELSILLEEINNEGEVKTHIEIWLQGIAFCSLMGLRGLEALVPNISKFKILKIALWKWVVLGSVIILAITVSRWIVKFILYFLKLSLFCRVRLLFIVTEENNSLRMFFLSVIVFPVGYVILYRQAENIDELKKSQYVVWSLLMLMIGSFTWLTMSILLKLHKLMCLHQIYFDRIKKVILEQCILRMLMSSSPERRNHETSHFNDLNQLNKKDITARIVDTLMKMIRDESLPSVDVVVTKSILRNITELGFNSNHVKKIKKFLSEQNALIINLFEEDKINENALHLWVVTIYKDRPTLLSDLRKTNTAIMKQHLVARIGVVIIFIIISGIILYEMIK